MNLLGGYIVNPLGGSGLDSDIGLCRNATEQYVALAFFGLAKDIIVMTAVFDLAFDENGSTLPTTPVATAIGEGQASTDSCSCTSNSLLLGSRRTRLVVMKAIPVSAVSQA